jgi:hypothetical protein
MPDRSRPFLKPIKNGVMLPLVPGCPGKPGNPAAVGTGLFRPSVASLISTVA